MFTSSLRRIFDVRLLSLTAVALLSACAIHRPDARPDAAPTPSNEIPALPHVVVPDFDVPIPDDSLLDLMTTESTTPAVTHWVTHAPSFVLVSTSEVASEEATAALQPTSVAFVRLFGERPSRIAVAVVDTSTGRPVVDVPEPPEGMTSIVMVVSGLTGSDSAATAQALTSELRFESATAWIFDYAAAWRVSLGLPGVQPLPDWMHLALLRLLTEPDAAVDNAHPSGGAKFISLEALFAHRVSEGEVYTVFANESTQLLLFLRDTMGETALANIVGATAAGMPMSEILRRLPAPMTTSELSVAFHAWSNAKLAVGNGSHR
ncbi:MAG: hypothetical protein JWL61_3427 [Gemmatimonadetes bacterium]|nr:hypothetical protein [Gemmatimonadota bacterium]